MLSAPAQEDRLILDSGAARDLAVRFGTPLYVMSEGVLRARARRFIAAFRSAWPGSEVSFASKANSTVAVIAILAQEGCLVDAASEGELRCALAAGVKPCRIHLHGNAKSLAELRLAQEVGVGQIIVDNFEEIETISSLQGRVPDLLLRLSPSVKPGTHDKIATGKSDTKFGFNIGDGSADRALRRCFELGLPLVGFHCHVGSQLLDPEAQKQGGRAIAEFASRALRETGFRASHLNLGGGVGVRYTPDDSEPASPEQYCRIVAEAVREGLAGTDLTPTLTQEPGRWMTAEAGVTLYRVVAVKKVPERTYVVVDGGMADNPRPGLYGARYHAELIPAQDRAKAAMADFTVAGRHCETDTLIERVSLPQDVRAGDLVQVLATGAYNASMASGYNRYPKPPVALLRDGGKVEIVQRSESFDEMLATESVPEDLR